MKTRISSPRCEGETPLSDCFNDFPRARRIVSSLAAVFAALCLAAAPLEQSPPALQMVNAGDSVRLEWEVRQDESSARLLKYQLERSTDLLTWSVYGAPLRSGATNELISRAIERGAEPSFYRLSVNPAEENSALASGGENVFGYSDMFSDALAAIGQISPEEFAARFSPNLDYLPALGWDPTTADFWTAFNTDPAVYNAGLISGVDDLRHFDFRLNPAELAAFKKNGFVVSERLGSSSCGEIYNRIWIDDLPVFITTDSVLQAWHRSYDSMLAEVEGTLLAQNFGEILDGMASKIQDANAQAPAALRSSVRIVDYYIAVARSLLRGVAIPSVLGQDARVSTTLASIASEQLDTCFDLFGEPRAIDFSQFKPRGHYVELGLQNYFKCLMWLGRIDFRVAGGPYNDSDCTAPHHAPPRELGSAIVLNWLLHEAGQFDRWLQSEKIIETFVGWTDSMTFAQLNEVLAQAGINTLSDVSDADALARVQGLLESGRVGLQNISSDYFISPLGGPPAALPQSFTVFGQKFVVDSWAFSELVADRILWVTNGQTNKVDRRVPSALDVAFGVLRNNQVVPDIVSRMTFPDASSSTNYPVRVRDGLPYQHNLAAVRTVIEEQPPSSWSQNIYMGWLDTLRQLSTPTAGDARLPDAMRTHAWAMKDLNTQLASWTQLRHDTLLYVKQSETSVFACSYPKGFVEPRPEFWKRMRDLSENVSSLIAQTDYGSQTNIQAAQAAFLHQFASTLDTLLSLSEKELRQEPFTDEEGDFISTTLVGARTYGGYWNIQDGWYPEMFYRSVLVPVTEEDFQQIYGGTMWDPLIADVHTDPPCGPCNDPGSVLYEAVGNPNLLLIAVNNGTNRCVYAGPVLSHYEFPVVGMQRLSDEDWKTRMGAAGLADWSYSYQYPFTGDSSGVPKPPEWTREYLVPSQP